MTRIEQILATIALLVVGIALCRSAIGLHRVALELALTKLSARPRRADVIPLGNLRYVDPAKCEHGWLNPWTVAGVGSRLCEHCGLYERTPPEPEPSLENKM